MRNFTVDKAETINGPDQVQTRGCNAIVFVNIGDEVAYVGNRPIPVYAAGMQEYPSIDYSGLEGELMQGQFDVHFSGAGAAPALLVIRKMYQ